MTPPELTIDPTQTAEELVEETVDPAAALVEEVSIDGMCGVY